MRQCTKQTNRDAKTDKTKNRRRRKTRGAHRQRRASARQSAAGASRTRSGPINGSHWSGWKMADTGGSMIMNSREGKRESGDRRARPAVSSVHRHSERASISMRRPAVLHRKPEFLEKVGPVLALPPVAQGPGKLVEWRPTAEIVSVSHTASQPSCRRETAFARPAPPCQTTARDPHVGRRGRGRGGGPGPDGCRPRAADGSREGACAGGRTSGSCGRATRRRPGRGGLRG